MVYRLLGWGIVGKAYHKIQIISYASTKITLDNEVSAWVKKYPKII